MNQINSIKERSLPKGKRLEKNYNTMRLLVEKINERDLNAATVEVVNEQVEILNSADDKVIKSTLRKTRSKILTVLEKEMKLVTANHYMTRWMALGMTVFGVPIGVSYGVAIDNMGMMGVGIAIGMSVGLAIGSGMDKKAKEEGRQLDVKI